MSAHRDYARPSSPMPKPTEPSTRQSPIVGYLVDNYSGHAALPVAAMKINEMLQRGITVTPAMVDYLITDAEQDWLTQFRRQGQERMARRHAIERVGYVYFVRNGDKIKIGYSTNPKKRVESLSLRESNIMGVIKAQPQFERYMHAMWAEYQVGNTEWFEASEALLAFIEGTATKWHYRHKSRTKVQPDIKAAYLRLAESLRIDKSEKSGTV